jgi:phosphohistidine phosphatase
MARQLWFLRHGDAEPYGARPDSERRLTERGEAQAVSAGRALAALGCSFAHLFTSPKVRGRDTARLAAPPLAAEPTDHEALASGFDRDDALELLHAAGAGERLLVVGHEPDFSQVVHDLTGARVDLKKGGVAGVRMKGTAGGELVVLLRPNELERIGAGPADA